MVDVPNQMLTPAAAALWRKIPDWAQEKLLANVWCPRCGAVTTIAAYRGAVVKGDLVLTGACSTCGGPVRRLIEGDD
jgi:endogenous inhibitor of DNA gyrase (YacG/DUF329 family)